MKPIRTWRRKEKMAIECARETCCTDNPEQSPSPACYNVGACGCRVVRHEAHSTPDINVR